MIKLGNVRITTDRLSKEARCYRNCWATGARLAQRYLALLYVVSAKITTNVQRYEKARLAVVDIGKQQANKVLKRTLLELGYSSKGGHLSRERNYHGRGLDRGS